MDADRLFRVPRNENPYSKNKRMRPAHPPATVKFKFSNSASGVDCTTELSVRLYSQGQWMIKIRNMVLTAHLTHREAVSIGMRKDSMKLW
ncbi:uncharacterized protein LOC112463350 isoform X2 [Temnothorax curvispinosus]|uniref:Uncharacterized protein LOC112463350 isoform X2 n=1 Tax=Temnothorax curvispinosus TaxID=300111 RepID=A0A6J1QXW1_9HYME|nr:uncharacterized protein LOC112463350 isoform X2 [Temnothorax curvispinosus]